MPAVTRVGEDRGAPVLVLPGGPCRDPEYLGDLAGISEVRELVVLHPRGTPRTGGLSHGWWTDADDVVAAIDALGVDAVDLVAHSAGTRLALAAAARFPGRIRSMALVTPPASWLTGTPYDGDSLPVDRGDPAVAAAILSLSHEQEPTTEEGFRAAFLRQAPASYAHWTEKEQQHARVGSMSLAAASAWFDGIPDDAAQIILSATLPPALVIGGDRDLLTGAQPVIDYAAALGARFAMIDDCGHRRLPRRTREMAHPPLSQTPRSSATARSSSAVSGTGIRSIGITSITSAAKRDLRPAAVPAKRCSCSCMLRTRCAGCRWNRLNRASSPRRPSVSSTRSGPAALITSSSRSRSHPKKPAASGSATPNVTSTRST
ncbi:alpha/beta hydrolase [Microbacterium esteraromaticum]|uniref:Alpha/beta hydrolase n=1 Tax=Microbacterium esteraromaticum TaxID=57043 RepID=A0A7D8AN67_9MICO|nr:alpha/beta hydrolase [Microbacterium esteraromaticum]